MIKIFFLSTYAQLVKRALRDTKEISRAQRCFFLYLEKQVEEKV